MNGNGQSIYYPVDEEDYIGINKAESSNIVLYLNENKINRISFVKSPVGTMKPLMDKVDAETILEGFEWREKERPVSRYDIFRSKDGEPIPDILPKSNINKPLPSGKGLRENTLKKTPVSAPPKKNNPLLKIE